MIGEQIIDLEIALMRCEKTIEELNEVVIKQGKMIDVLIKQQKALFESLEQTGIKPSAEEVPPPHY